MNKPITTYDVIDCNGTLIFSFITEGRANAEADELNRTGLIEFRPYGVVKGTA